MFHPAQIETLASLRREERLRTADQRRLVRPAARRRRAEVFATFPTARWFGAPVDATASGEAPLRRRTGLGAPTPRCC